MPMQNLQMEVASLAARTLADHSSQVDDSWLALLRVVASLAFGLLGVWLPELRYWTYFYAEVLSVAADRVCLYRSVWP